MGERFTRFSSTTICGKRFKVDKRYGRVTVKKRLIPSILHCHKHKSVSCIGHQVNERRKM